MKAILVAGGEGTRLRPLTYHTPKPLLPLCDRPIIVYQIELCRKHGIRDIVINLHYLADSLETYLGDGSQLGVRISYSHERDALGTAGAVKLAEPFFDGESMIVFNGDVLTDLDLSRLLALHRERRAVATLTTTEVHDPTPFGLIVSDASGRIDRFLEKPSREEALRFGDRFFINAGTYVLEPEIFATVPTGTNWSFERQVFPGLLAAGKPLFAFHGKAYWRDVGSPPSYLAAHRDLLAGKLARPERWIAAGPGPRAFLGGPAELPPDLEISGGPCFVGQGVRFGRGVRLEDHAVLADGSEIGDGALVRGAIVGAGASIGAGSEIVGGIVGPRCRVESDVKIMGAAVLADGSVIGKGSVLG